MILRESEPHHHVCVCVSQAIYVAKAIILSLSYQEVNYSYSLAVINNKGLLSCSLCVFHVIYQVPDLSYSSLELTLFN